MIDVTKLDFSQPPPKVDNLEDAEELIEALELYTSELNGRNLEKEKELIDLKKKLRELLTEGNVTPIKLTD